MKGLEWTGTEKDFDDAFVDVVDVVVEEASHARMEVTPDLPGLRHTKKGNIEPSNKYSS